MAKTKADFEKAANRWEKAGKNWELRIANLECRKRRAKTKADKNALQVKINKATEKRKKALEFEERNREQALKRSRKQPGDQAIREKLTRQIITQQIRIKNQLETDLEIYKREANKFLTKSTKLEGQIEKTSGSLRETLKRQNFIATKEFARNFDKANIANEKLQQNAYRNQDDPRQRQLEIKQLENQLKTEKLANLRVVPGQVDLWFGDYLLWLEQTNVQADYEIAERKNRWALQDIKGLKQNDPVRIKTMKQIKEREVFIKKSKAKFSEILKKRRKIDDQITNAIKISQT